MRAIGGITDANGSRCFYIMSELSEIFSYNGNDVTFKTVDDVTYVNATEMAKYFNRRTNDYLSLVSTNELVKAITRKTGKSENQLVIKKTGMPVFGGGVWLHEDIAIDFAQWLSVDFKLWCTDKIKELLLKGHKSTIGACSLIILSDILLASSATFLASANAFFSFSDLINASNASI